MMNAVAPLDPLTEAFSALVARDDALTRRRFYDVLLTSRLYMTVTDDRSAVTGKALRLRDGTIALPAFLDETALRSWISSPTRYGTMSAKAFFSGAAKMEIDAVVINPGGPALQINRPSIILLGQGLNPAAIPQGPLSDS